MKIVELHESLRMCQRRCSTNGSSGGSSAELSILYDTWVIMMTDKFNADSINNNQQCLPVACSSDFHPISTRFKIP